MKRGLLLVALVGGPAMAQINTTCQQYGTMTNCQTTGENPAQQALDNLQRQTQANQQQMQNNIFAAAAAVRERRAERAREDAMQAETTAQANADWQRKQAGSMVADGKCDAARKFALEAGNFDLANQVGQACAPKP